MTENAEKILNEFHNFDDGLLLTFEYSYPTNQPLTARIVAYGKNHSTENQHWEKVEFLATDIEEIKIKIKGNQFNSITTGIRLLKFNNLWCLDIDGNYNFDKDPASLKEIQQYGECYIIASSIKARKLIEL
ncbi:hypothetical protein ACIOVF_01320 [Pseudomonas sp. NPDC087612]|uniref:hypothetical protein n=1 Tax=Pseudomonas sp. NPDC087612 TaxID=3364441 RepID=UPI003811B54B